LDTEIAISTPQGDWGREQDENGYELWCAIPKLKAVPTPTSTIVPEVTSSKPIPPEAYIDVNIYISKIKKKKKKIK